MGTGKLQHTLFASYFLYAALLLYSFSIAGFSLFFGLMVLLTLINFKLMYAGVTQVWNEYRNILIAVLLLFLITAIGVLWSDDTKVAVHKVMKQLNWLILPAILGLAQFVPNLRKRAFLTLSIGLTLHMLLCSLQYLGIIEINRQGSNALDATGFIGHLSFGFIYGIWAGALIVAAKELKMREKFLCYALAIYALLTIFMAQGRSGYIIAFLLMLLVVWKVLFQHKQKIKLVALIIFIVGVTSFFALHTPSQSKLKQTWSGAHAFLNGNWSQSDERIKIWATAIEISKNNPWIGIGTGDYKPESIVLLSQEAFKQLRAEGNQYFYHPHNEFLFALVRWGPIGLFIVLYLCWAWVSTGWKKDWENDTMNAYLMTSSGLAIVIHGMTEVSLNSKLTLVFAIVALAFSMTKETNKEPL